MEYVTIPKFTKVGMENAIIDDDIEKLIYVSLFASLYYEDRDFAEEVCIKPAEHQNKTVRAMAIEGFEHIARIDGQSDKEIVKPIYRESIKRRRRVHT